MGISKTQGIDSKLLKVLFLKCSTKNMDDLSILEILKD